MAKRGRKRKIVVGQGGKRYTMHPQHQGKKKIKCCGSKGRPGCKKVRSIDDFYPSQLAYPGVLCRECTDGYNVRAQARKETRSKIQAAKQQPKEEFQPDQETVLAEREMALIEELVRLNHRMTQVEAKLETIKDLRNALTCEQN